MPSPKLLDREWLLRQDRETINRSAVRETGQVAKHGLPGPEEFSKLRSAVAVSHRHLWETFLLLEAGLLSPDDESRKALLDGFQFEDQKSGFDDVPPPGELHEILLAGGRFAGALIPLDGSKANEQPATLAIWRIGNGDPVIVIPDNEGFVVGDSGQLAQKLTSRALDDASKEKPEDYRVKLASDWIITGALDGDKIREVSLGNKTNLRLDRRWLLPRPNFMSEKPEAWREAPRYAESMEEAKRTVTGSLQTRSLSPLDWPEKTSVLFSFTSKAVRPALAATLLCKPNHLILMSTEDAESKASSEVLQKIVPKLLPDTEVITVEGFPSHDLSLAHSRLKEILQEHAEAGPSLLNLTNGNLLMRAAAILELKSSPELSFVYKDQDNPTATEFTHIRYTGEEEYETRILAGKRERHPDLNWDVFLQRDQEPSEGKAKELLKKLKAFPES